VNPFYDLNLIDVLSVKEVIDSNLKEETFFFFFFFFLKGGGVFIL